MKQILVVALVSVIGAMAHANVLSAMDGKWRGQNAQGCAVTLQIASGSSSLAYQLQCPGNQAQNQLALAPTSVTATGFTQTQSTNWFGNVQTDTLTVNVAQSGADGRASQLSFHFERSGQAPVDATLARDLQ